MTKDTHVKKIALKKELEKQEALQFKMKCKEFIDTINRYKINDNTHLLDIDVELQYISDITKGKCTIIDAYRKSYDSK